MARAVARIAAARYRTDIRAGNHDLVADEGAALGVADVGPAPYELLLAALGACTAMTLKMYAERKGWPLEALEVDLAYHKADEAMRERLEAAQDQPGLLGRRRRLSDRD